MTQSDRQRQNVHLAIKAWKFQDRDMRVFADAASIKLDEVLDHAKEIITSTDASPHDQTGAKEIVAMIRMYTTSDED